MSLLVLPLATLFSVACGDGAFTEASESGGSNGHGGNGAAGKAASGGALSPAGVFHGGASRGGSASMVPAGSNDAGSAQGAQKPEGGSSGSLGGQGADSAGGEGVGGAAAYEGPSVGRATTFATLAYSAITTANISEIGGELGVSAGAMSTITGFDALSYKKYGIDSLAPDSQRTILAQQDVTALVADIDPRPCDVDLTNVVGGLTGDITLKPGVTCMNSFAADVLLNGHVYLDAGGDRNAFFIIRGNLTLTVADAAQLVLQNGAQACSVFWRISKQVTIGKAVRFFGTVISGSAITMKTGSTLGGRALAQTAGVQLDANSVSIPAACTHIQ